MASGELRRRGKWQNISLTKAIRIEDLIQSALDTDFPEQFTVDKHPDDFQDIYSKYSLPDDVSQKIYNVNVNETKPNGKARYKLGIVMDFAIRNIINGKVLFGEIKRQDGWVETTDMKAGRGNAHEICCKYFTPGILRLLREKSRLSDDILPFWIVFAGDTTRDPRRNREIAFWFQGYTKNFYMWRDTNNHEDIAEFFKRNLLPYLL